MVGVPPSVTVSESRLPPPEAVGHAACVPDQMIRPRWIGTQGADRACEIVLVAGRELLKRIVVEVLVNRARSRDDRRSAHRDEVVHLEAMSQIPERVAFHRDNAGIGVRDRLDELVDRYPAVEGDDILDRELSCQLLERGCVRALAVDA